MSTKLTGLLIKGVDKKYIKKLILSLIKEVVLCVIKDKLMTEFIKRDLQTEYKEELKAWFVYLDQQDFGKELERKMLIEIDRFMAERKTAEEVIGETINKPVWEIEFLGNIPKNYLFKAALGYS